MAFDGCVGQAIALIAEGNPRIKGYFLKYSVTNYDS